MLKQKQISQQSFNRLVIAITLLFVALCGTFSEMTLSQAKEVTHDSIQAVSSPVIPDNSSEKPNNSVCSLSSVDCDGEVVAQKAPVAPTKPVERVAKVKIASVSSDTRPIKIGASKAVQERIDYAWAISHDKDFIYTLEVENAGTWDINIKSYRRGANGYFDRGICQFNEGYHPSVVNNPKFADAGWQIDQCWKHYKGGTRFYGYDVRWKAIKNFKWE